MTSQFFKNDDSRELETSFVGKVVTDVYFMEADGVMYLSFEMGDQVVGLEVGAGKLIQASLAKDSYTVH